MNLLQTRNRGFIIPSKYDTTIGCGVSFDGYANLPLRNGAKRFFVNSNGGSNSTIVAAQSPSSPAASIAYAMEFIADSQGDHIMVAEGQEYSESLANTNGKRGFSPQFPVVIQTYDPLDPMNPAKWGRPRTRNRPVIHSPGHYWGGGGGAYPHQPSGCIAVRGLYFDSTGVAGSAFDIVPPNGLNNGFFLFENNIFDGMFFGYEQSSNGMQNGSRPGGPLIWRGNSTFGQWQTGHAHTQATFISGGDNITVEDCFHWHNAWKVGVSRDELTDNGGLNGDEVFRHIHYMAEDNKFWMNRRNGYVDGPADGSQQRCPVKCYRNLYIDNPMSITAGGGLESQVTNPLGTHMEFLYNTILGDADITSSFPRGQGATVSNGTADSIAAYNLFARTRQGTAFDVMCWSNSTFYEQPSYMTWDHNTIYSWCKPGQEIDNRYAYSDPRAGFVFNTVTNNRWDGAAGAVVGNPSVQSSGGNVNNGSVAYSNPYTALALYTALGYAGADVAAKKQAFVDKCRFEPESRAWMQAIDLLQAGYNINTSGMPQ